jgi:hypothetical protein
MPGVFAEYPRELLTLARAMLAVQAEVPMLRTIAKATMVAALAAGCYEGEVQYRGTVAVSGEVPDLAYVEPGVQVIADYDEPIFFADGFYWWSVDGAWYRSSYYTGGWVYVATPPLVVMRIREPHRFRHYRPSGYVVHRRPVPSHRVQRPGPSHRAERPHIRDHR